MIDTKTMTAQERLEYIQKASAERNAKNSEKAPVNATKPAKNIIKKQQKTLSKAAVKRAEKEQQEASKSNVEKLVEKIKRRSTVIAKHNSVVNTVNAVKKRNTPIKRFKLKPVKKVKEQAPAQASTQYEKMQAQIVERDQQQHRLLKQAELIRNRLAKISSRESVKTIEGLRDCYGIYEIIENSQDADVFYGIIRSHFTAILEKIQSNTPDEGLLARFIFPRKNQEENKRYNKRISEYATVIRYAKEVGVAKKDFVKWYADTTQTRILEKARQSASADNKDKLKRATTALLRYFDIREQWPLGHFEYPAHLADMNVHLPDGYIFAICRGVRKFNRDVHFDPENPNTTRVAMAEISALHFIPPNIDLTNDLITRVAKYLAPRIESIEEEINTKTEQVWANDLSNLLMERELGAAYMSADRWADRLQTGFEEDQMAFEAKRRKIQKLRNKSRK